MKKINIIISLLFYGFTIAIFCPPLPDLPEQTKGLKWGRSKEERQQQYKDEVDKLLEAKRKLNDALQQKELETSKEGATEEGATEEGVAHLGEKTGKMLQESYKHLLTIRQERVNKRLEELRKNDETKKIVEEAEKKQRETAAGLNEIFEPGEGAQGLAQVAHQLNPLNQIRNDIQNTIAERLKTLISNEPVTLSNYNAAGYKSAWEEAYKNKLEADHLLQYIDDLQKHKNSAGVEGLEELKTGAESASKKWGEQLEHLKSFHEERFKRFNTTEEKSLRIKREVLQDLSPLAENIQKLDVKLTAGYEPLTSFDNAMFYLTDVGRTFARKAKVLFNKAKIKFGNKSLETREALAKLYGLLGDEIGQIKNARLAAQKTKDVEERLNKHIKSLQDLDLQKDTDKEKFDQEVQDTAEMIIKGYYSYHEPKEHNLEEVIDKEVKKLKKELIFLDFKPKDYKDIDDFISKTRKNK